METDTQLEATYRRSLKRKGNVPIKLEKRLKKTAALKGLTGSSKGAYVYGTLRKTGWKPSREK